MLQGFFPRNPIVRSLILREIFELFAAANHGMNAFSRLVPCAFRNMHEYEWPWLPTCPFLSFRASLSPPSPVPTLWMIWAGKIAKTTFRTIH